MSNMTTIYADDTTRTLNDPRENFTLRYLDQARMDSKASGYYEFAAESFGALRDPLGAAAIIPKINEWLPFVLPPGTDAVFWITEEDGLRVDYNGLSEERIFDLHQGLLDLLTAASRM